MAWPNEKVHGSTPLVVIKGEEKRKEDTLQGETGSDSAHASVLPHEHPFEASLFQMHAPFFAAQDEGHLGMDFAFTSRRPHHAGRMNIRDGWALRARIDEMMHPLALVLPLPAPDAAGDQGIFREFKRYERSTGVEGIGDRNGPGFAIDAAIGTDVPPRIHESGAQGLKHLRDAIHRPSLGNSAQIQCRS